MEILNLLSKEEYYQSGLWANGFNLLVRAPSFIDTIILDNNATLSDAHTYYYASLLHELHKDKTILVLLSNPQQNEMLVNGLNKLGIETVDENMVYNETYTPMIIPRWRVLKNRKLKKSRTNIYKSIRHNNPDIKKRKRILFRKKVQDEFE